MVLVGHCTRNDCALAPNVAIQVKRNSDQNLDCFFMALQPPSELCADIRPHCCGHTGPPASQATVKVVYKIWARDPTLEPFRCPNAWGGLVATPTAWCHTTSVRNLLFAAYQTASKFFLPVQILGDIC